MPKLSSEITISLHGRSLGIQYMSSAQTGSTQGRDTFLVGPDAFRIPTATAETTSVAFDPYGISFITTGTSRVFNLNPPIPGVEKFIVSSAASVAYVKSRNLETFESSQGTTFTVMTLTSHANVHLLGLTTARWMMLNGGSSGTSSQGSAVTLSTTT
jgi:hypothetical protein